MFDLDHLGTLGCKKLRAKGACAVLFDCQNTETCKRKGHDGLLVFSVLNGIPLHELPCNDEPLEFVGPLPDGEQGGVTVVAFDVVFW